MDKNTSISHGPLFGIGYMPYFYSSGKFLLYDISGRGADSPKYRSVGVSNFTNDIVPKKTPTVEDIIEKGYFAVPESEPETAIISDKNHTSRLGLGDIIDQIRGRYEIYAQNMYQIELNKCSTINSQLSIEASRGGVAANSKEAYGLTKSLNELYVQQCRERRDLWADISKLKLTLPEQAQSYLSSYRKLSILDPPGGDLL